MQKMCLSCGISFSLSGSGRRQKYCQKCATRATGQGRVSRPSNSLKVKAAKTGFEDAWVDRLSRLEMEGPIALLVGEDLWRLWPSQTTRGADARHWRLTVKGVRDAATIPPKRKEKPVAVIKGFRVRLVLEMEAPAIGCGSRLVTVQFRTVRRRKKVSRLVELHCARYSDTITREAFKELVASNRRYRKRNAVERSLLPSMGPVLKLVVNNPPADTTKEDAA